MDMKRAIELIMHDGLQTYKQIGSSAPLPNLLKARKKDNRNKKGAICLVRSKEHLSTVTGVKGYVVTSMETLLEDALSNSHWTPNVSNYLRYSDEKRMYVKDHGERNLQQINTFVVDIDSKQQPYTEILTAALDNSIGAPTMVLETPKGYQAYFVLENPLFISNRNDYQGLKVAKRISENIKRSLAEVLEGVDISCNDFGFFRIPQKDNIRWFSEEMLYDFGGLIAWSKRQDDNHGRGLFVVAQPKGGQDATKTEWFRELLAIRDVKGEAGQIGRDNLMYTLALACYSSGNGVDETLDLLDEYNSSLKQPLRHHEICKVVKSAYKGRFKGAHQSYIRELLEVWGSGRDVTVKSQPRGWYKFKKKREERKRSHYEEWEADLLNYIQEATSLEEPIKWTTQRAVCEELGIAKSTFNEVIKRSKKILIKRQGKGRMAQTGLTSVAVLFQCALVSNEAHRAAYYHSIRHMVGTKENHSAIRALNEQLESFNLKEALSKERRRTTNSS